MEIFKNNFIYLLIVFIIFDVIFGCLRALKEKEINSTIGIDGIIRKIGMIVSIIMCILIDKVINFNLIEFIPNDIKNIIGVHKIGTIEVFSILYIVFETLSILKNMYKCKLPIPKKLKIYLEKLLKEYTKELKGSDE